MDKVRVRTTAAQIAAIPAGVTERYISDESVRNLFLKISPGGSKSWFWISKLKDEKRSSRKLMIGRYPSFSMADARERAGLWNAMRDRGVDPVAVARAEVEAEAAALEAERERLRHNRENSLRAVWERYIVSKASAKSIKEKRRLVERNVLDDLGDRPINELTRKDIRAAIDKVIERKASATGNRVLSELRPFFDWVVDRDLIETNIAATVRKDLGAEGKNPRRDLNLSELAYLWRATSAVDGAGKAVLDDDERDFFRLLLLTGCRRSESSGAKRSELVGSCWEIPRERAKTDVKYRLPLVGLSLAIFVSRKDQERPLLFCDKWHKAIFKKAIGRFEKEVDKVAGKPVENWDLHSIRHGFRTAIVEYGCTDPYTAERIINHSADRYDHGQYLPHKLEAMTKWEALLMGEVARQEAEAEAA